MRMHVCMLGPGRVSVHLHGRAQQGAWMRRRVQAGMRLCLCVCVCILALHACTPTSSGYLLVNAMTQ